MAQTSNLGERMKGYEAVSKTILVRRVPVIIRLDGKAFHTFTKGLQKPFNAIMSYAMQETMHSLCKEIQGCVFGYTQSDEITLVLADYFKLDTSPWFDYEVQKMCSVAASMATIFFNRYFEDGVKRAGEIRDAVNLPYGDSKMYTSLESYERHLEMMPVFDARCFNIPLGEVTNNIYWRQRDATRNSIQAAAQANFSHKQIQGCNCDKLQDMLFKEFNINWNDYPTVFKRGCSCYKKPLSNGSEEKVWFVDFNMPILTGDGRNHVEQHISPSED